MTTEVVARRRFLRASALASGAGLFPLSIKAQTAAAAGVTPGDLPNFTIKEVKVYVTASGRLASITTESGVEGICTLQSLVFHANWDNSGWLDYAKRALAGKNALDHLQFTSQYAPVSPALRPAAAIRGHRYLPVGCSGQVDGQPVHRMLGAYKDRVPAYASSQHLETRTPGPYVEAARKARAEGFRAFKINPPPVEADGDSHYRLDMEICKALRSAMGDDFMLIHHAVGNYTRNEALEVGRLLDDLHFRGYEDPLPSTDIDGLAQLCQELKVPVIVGEFMFSLYDYPEYIRRGAADMLRFVVDNVGGITPGVKIGILAECHGMECTPHGVGSVLHQAAHLACSLAMPNSAFVEVPDPAGNPRRATLHEGPHSNRAGRVRSCSF